MGIKLSSTLASRAAASFGLSIDETYVHGSSGQPDSPPLLSLYAGTRPASITTPITTQTLLVSFGLSDPSFISGDTPQTIDDMMLVLPADKLAIATGEASFFRILAGDNGSTLFEGDITDRTGNGDLKISTVSIVSGQFVRPLSMVLSVPQDQTL